MDTGTRTAGMTTQIIPMQLTSMKTAIHTRITLIMIIHITIILPTNMLIMTIPITTTVITIIPL